MIFVITLIQIMGSIMVQSFGSLMGSILSRFFGGLVSSTVTTANLAKKSNTIFSQDCSSESLTFLAATCAMLLEAMALLLIGTKDIHLSLILILLGPLLVTAFMIFRLYQKTNSDQSVVYESNPIVMFSVLKLAAFIIAILALSNFLQNIWGGNGLFILTFIMSLFEIHGSVIANVQLHDAGSFNFKFLGSLLTISILSFYISKLFLVYRLGSSKLKTQITKYTICSILSLCLTWVLFAYFTKS